MLEVGVVRWESLVWVGVVNGYGRVGRGSRTGLTFDTNCFSDTGVFGNSLYNFGFSIGLCLVRNPSTKSALKAKNCGIVN